MDEESRSSDDKGSARRNVLIGGIAGLVAALVARVRGAEASYSADAIRMGQINLPAGRRTTLLGPYAWGRLDEFDGSSEVLERPAAGSVWDLQTGMDPHFVPPIPATLEVISSRDGTIPLVVQQFVPPGTTPDVPAAQIGGAVVAQRVECLSLAAALNFACGTVFSAICPAGTDTCVVPHPACTPDSYVGAAVTTAGRTFVQAVEPGTGQITVYFNARTRQDTPFRGVVVNSVQPGP